MNNHQNPDGTQERQEIIARALSAVEAGRRMLQGAGLTGDSCLEAVRQSQGEDAVERTRREIGKTLVGFEDQIRRDAFDVLPARRLSRKVALRGFV